MSNVDDASQPINQQRSPSYFEYQPTRHQDYPRWKRLMHKLDIFAFLPTPRTYPVSTKRSLIGSFLLFFLFMGYIIYSFIDFLTNNVPRVNEVTELDNATGNTVGPQLAIQFLWGKSSFDERVLDPSYFTITMQKVIKYKNPSIEDNTDYQIPMTHECNSATYSWIPESPYNYSCPTEDLILSGLLYQTEEFVYPRIQIDYCKQGGEIQCKTEQEIAEKVAGGRLFLYIQNRGPNKNYVTGKTTDIISYEVYQYFLVPSLYNRAEIVLQKQNVSITGNYLTSFNTEYDTYLTVSKQYFYVSNVTVFGAGSAAKGFQIFIRLDQEVKVVQVVKVTIVDVVAKWGAFWGVLFAAFAFYFLRFNQDKFYIKNPNWAAYDEAENLQSISKQV